ncbi:hypothetical protein BsWGS_21003 [Bradybaena similaris]
MEFRHNYVWMFLLLGATKVSSQSLPHYVGMPYFYVYESATIGSVIYTLKGVDKDPNETLTFSANSVDTSTLFNVSATTLDKTTNQWTCNLTLKSGLDRDHSPASRTLYFVLTDKDKLTAPISITMIITDVNDNPPQFVQLPYRISLPENAVVGTTVFKVTATDPDMNSGGTPVYFITAANGDYHQTFEVNNSTGQIELKKPLDYEMLSFYHYNVSARDEGNPPCPGADCICGHNNNFDQSDCNPEPVDLFITITDVQNQPPEFRNLPYITTVAENTAKGSSIFQVTAVDGDRGVSQANRIHYTLSGAESSQFSIDPTNGTIMANAILDADKEDVRNKGGLYMFNVTATEESWDSSENPNNKTVTPVSITVTDINDNPPRFKESHYSASVQENTPKGVPVTVTSSIEVEDIDQGVNSRFWVDLEKDGSPYSDFDTLPAANVIIQGRSTITIRVFNSSALDYENTKNITFQLVARENNTNPSISTSSVATVSLTIIDVNDNSPQFPVQPKIFNVSEDEPIGYVIANITATDVDSGDFGVVVFSLEDNGLDGTFNISEQGVIALAQHVDWGVRNSYTLAVIASDSPQHEDQRRQSTYRIQVNIIDVNDKKPTWAQYVDYVTVLEGNAVGTKVTDLRATDLDGGVNSEIEYVIVPGTNGSRLFGVNQTKEGFAEIYIQQSLIDNVGLYLLTIMAEDKGSPPLNSTLDLSIFVIDENQNYPIFVNPDETKFNTSAGKWPEIKILEEQPIQTELYTLYATDKDTGQNGLVEYFLKPTSNKDYEYFIVERFNGTLKSARRLDKETKATYEIEVTAQDNGQPAPLLKTLPIRIVLEDINDNQPVYKRSDIPQPLQVVEESNDAVIGQLLQATDLDAFPNNVTCYYLYGGDHISGLLLDRKTRNLSLTQKVDRESTPVLNIVIKASENCNLSSSFFISNNPSSNAAASTSGLDTPPAYNSSDDSLLWVKVTVLDINDNPPQFSSRNMSASVVFDVGIGTQIMSLADNITDKDTPANRKSKFKLLSTTHYLQAGDTVDLSTPPFAVSVNGSVTTDILFQTEMLGYFLLQVLAYDDDGLNDTANIKMFLISSSDRLRLVFNKLVNEVEQQKASLVTQLSDILNVNIIMDKIQGHVNAEGSKDASKTDAYIHGRYRSNGNIVPATDLSRMIDLSQTATRMLETFGVTETQTASLNKPADPGDELKKIFIIVAAVLALIVVSLFVVLLYMVNLYRRRLLAATTVANASPLEKETIEHPGTNKYLASENPLFGREIKPVDHDDDNDDASSHNSLDQNAVDTAFSYLKSHPTEVDEEQEVHMRIGDGNDMLPVSHFSRSSNLDQVLQAYTSEANRNGDADDIDEYGNHLLKKKKMAPSIPKGDDSLGSMKGQQFNDEIYDEIHNPNLYGLHLEHTEI